MTSSIWLLKTPLVEAIQLNLIKEICEVFLRVVFDVDLTIGSSSMNLIVKQSSKPLARGASSAILSPTPSIKPKSDGETAQIPPCEVAGLLSLAVIQI